MTRVAPNFYSRRDNAPMPPPQEKMDLHTWNELCRQQDAVRADAAATRRYEALTPEQKWLTPAERQTLERWSVGGSIALLYTLVIGWAGTLIFGLAWFPGLPLALASYTYQAVPAQITVFDPKSCGRSAGSTRPRGVHYTYTYQGRPYESTRVLPAPFSFDYVDACGEKIKRDLGRQTSAQAVTAYVNPFLPTVAVLRPGIPVSLTGMFGLLSLLCVFIALWSLRVQHGLRERGIRRMQAEAVPAQG